MSMATPARDERVEGVLVDHQRAGIEGCACGWAELGKSHPGHVAGLLFPVIESEEALEALPAGTVLHDADGDVYRKSLTMADDGELVGVYWQAGPQGRFRTVALPARVLEMGAQR